MLDLINFFFYQSKKENTTLKWKGMFHLENAEIKHLI